MSQTSAMAQASISISIILIGLSLTTSLSFQQPTGRWHLLLSKGTAAISVRAALSFYLNSPQRLHLLAYHPYQSPRLPYPQQLLRSQSPCPKSAKTTSTALTPRTWLKLRAPAKYAAGLTRYDSLFNSTILAELNRCRGPSHLLFKASLPLMYLHFFVKNYNFISFWSLCFCLRSRIMD